MNIKQRLIALEQVKTYTLAELPMIASDDSTDEEIKQLQRNGRKVYRESAPALIEEFI
jgi:hypothetical protein